MVFIVLNVDQKTCQRNLIKSMDNGACMCVRARALTRSVRLRGKNITDATNEKNRLGVLLDHVAK